MTLEDRIKEAAAKGLTHLTLWPVFSTDGKTTYWCVRATPSTQHRYVQATNLDPVAALDEALRELPRASRRSKQDPIGAVTAAVISDNPPSTSPPTDE